MLIARSNFQVRFFERRSLADIIENIICIVCLKWQTQPSGKWDQSDSSNSAPSSSRGQGY